jgi:hypothetical protein
MKEIRVCFLAGLQDEPAESVSEILASAQIDSRRDPTWSGLLGDFRRILTHGHVGSTGSRQAGVATGRAGWIRLNRQGSGR